ncbi:Glycoside hydrolase, family 77 [Dillenia turbinata]|uniref:4-alpha-glucanotransferase n=1 Tax=Dillenia turbinata TaxID=194707 RepID=A0AAN8WA37_9MAGN
MDMLKLALHPLYLRVQALSKNKPEEIKAVDYEATLATKIAIAKKIFALEKDIILESNSFQKFLSENEEELEREGIWDFDRLSRPYIKQEFLQFKEDCNTEKKIASKLKTCMEKSLFLESEDKIRRHLFDLLRNMVLIRDPEDARKFYPRFNLEDTSSFEDLDDHRFVHHHAMTAPLCVPGGKKMKKEDRFYKNIVESEDIPPSKCTPEIAYFIVKQHMDAPSMWAIFPLQDLLALKEEYMTRPAAEETINDPTNPKHYWRYRVHMTLERLHEDNKLKTMIKELVCGSGRSHPPVEEAEMRLDQEKVPVVPEKQQSCSNMGREALSTQSNGASKKPTLTIT